jgi:hypothetical protein
LVFEELYRQAHLLCLRIQDDYWYGGLAQTCRARRFQLDGTERKRSVRSGRSDVYDGTVLHVVSGLC